MTHRRFSFISEVVISQSNLTRLSKIPSTHMPL